MKIVHITTVHQRFDSRIFYKECCSLQKEFGDVSLIVADGKGDEIVGGVKIIDIGIESNRLKRILFSSDKAIKKAMELNADVYHFHDADLLIACRKLSKYGKVIFDSHEDFPLLMLQRPYIPKILRKSFYFIAKHIERKTFKKLSAIVTATDNINKKFYGYDTKKTNTPNTRSKPIVTVRNFPIIENNTNENFYNSNAVNRFTLNTACYVGGLTQIRGVEQMIRVCEKAGFRLILAGSFDDEVFFEKMKSLSGWKNVEYLGFVPHKELNGKVYNCSSVGLNMLLSAPNHTDSIPIKQLEYMSVGLPVIMTKHINFCKQVDSVCHCGVLVTPENIDECFKALNYLKQNPDKAKQMGDDGKNAACTLYNWENEKKNLINLYKNLS